MNFANAILFIIGFKKKCSGFTNSEMTFLADSHSDNNYNLWMNLK